MTLSDAIAQKLITMLPSEQVLPYSAWSDQWQARVKAAYQGDVQTCCMVSPHTPEELSEVMILAHHEQWRVLVAGQGTKLGWGAPAQKMDLLVSLHRLNRLIDHAVGDMTVTVEAGLSFAALQTHLTQHQQWLPLDPAYATQATLGGILATRDAGSLRHRYGGMRDLCLGITLVRADGQIAKAGGRVVKNVAGYDLMKLFTGSFGTLGVVSAMTLRAYPLPECSGTVLVEGPTTAIATLAQAMLQSTLTPTAADAILGPNPDTLTLAIRFQGLAASVVAQIDRVKEMALREGLTIEVLTTATEAQWWQQAAGNLQERLDPDEVFCQFGVLPTLAVSSLAAFQAQVASTRGMLQGRVHVGSGLGQLRLSGIGPAAGTVLGQLRSHCTQAGGYLTVLAAPAAVKQQFEVWGYAGNALAAMRRLKERFDPQGILNPGRFVGGI